MPAKKKAAKAPAKTSELSRLLFDANPQPAWLFDRATLRVLDVNEAALRKYGYNRPEFLRLRLEELLPPEDAVLLRQEVSGLVSGANTVWQARHRLKSRRIIDVEVVSHPIAREGREAVLSIIFDVTDQKRVEEALRGARSELDAVVADAPIVLFSLDAAGVFTLSRGRGLEALGLKPGEAVGRSVFEMYRNQPHLLTDVRRALAGEVFTGTAEVSGRIFETRYLPQHAAAPGVVTGVIGVSTDVTERRIVDAVLKQQSAAMTASMDGMAILDHEGRYIYLNDAHAKIYGYDAAEQLLGRSWKKLYAPKELERFDKEVMPEFWRIGQWRGEAVGRRRDGTPFPQEISLSKIDDFSETGDGMVCVVRDISQRKLAEDEHNRLFSLEKSARAEAEAASHAKDEFLALVSHELRTPMTAILGWTWLLRSGEAEFGRALDIIERNMKLQAQIIEDLLDVSSIITGKLSLEKRPVELGPVLQQAADTVRSAAESKRVSLKLDSHDVVVLGDASRLQQVLWNLLSNAIKFNQEGGVVHVTIRGEGGRAVISVVDDGQGITADFLPAVFDPFRQAEGSLTRRHSGLGIGLAIVRHLVELHSGTVKAHSEGAGKGAAFTVDLPLHVGKPGGKTGKRGPKAPAAPAGQTLEALRILLVDDEPDTLTMLSELLKFHGAVVTTASSAAKALGILADGHQDLLISDIAMPGEDGLSLIRKVRARDPHQGGEVCAMALTACAKPEDRDMALKAGFQVYMAKPVEPDELLGVIRRLSRASPYSK